MKIFQFKADSSVVEVRRFFQELVARGEMRTVLMVALVKQFAAEKEKVTRDQKFITIMKEVV